MISAILVGSLALAQDSSLGAENAVAGLEWATGSKFSGVPSDWSTHHLVFSGEANPAAAGDAQRDPRYWMQILRRAAGGQPGDAIGFSKHRHRERVRVRKDWSYDLGNNAKVGAGMYPAKFSFDVNSANCSNATSPDYAVYNTGVAGSSSQPNIVGFTNLYSGCNGTVPSVYWAYNTGTGAVVTSPVLSLDGTRLAFVETSSANHAILRLLQWKSGQGSFNTTTHVWTTGTINKTSTNWGGGAGGCPSGNSCLISLTFDGNPQDTNSSPYYDYSNDILYVGDDNGKLHKFINVFGVTGTTPSEVTTGGWPAALTNSSGMKTTGPVLDQNTGSVFIGTARTSDFSGTGGYLYRVDSSSGSATASSQIARVPGIVDSPVIDPVAARVYLSSPDASFSCGFFQPCGAMFQFSAGFSSGDSGTEEQLGSGAQTVPMYAGAFDNAYYTSANPLSPTGNIYVCADTGSSGAAVLYQVPIASNVIGSPNAGPTLSSSGTTCSPVTEFLPSSASTDLIFMSVQSNGSTADSIGCPGGGGGCAMSFNVFSGSTPTSTASRVGAVGGTSGIVVDNKLTSSPSGGSQVYFSQLSNATCGTSGGTGGCAIQASQAALTE